MKNLFKIFMALVALVAYSCTTDITEDLGVQLGGGAGQTTVTLSLEESRTQLGAEVDGLYPLYWSEGDKISVNGVESGEAVIDSDNPALATFTINGTPSVYNVAYPAAPEGKVRFAAVQNHVVTGDTFESGVSTMYGRGTVGSGIQMQHLTGVLQLGILGEATLSKVQISTVDRTPIAGEFKIDFETGKLTATAESKDVIEYSFGEGLTLSKTEATTIHVVVPAGVYDELYLTLYESGKSGNIMYATVKAGKDNPDTEKVEKPLAAGKVREFGNVLYAPNAKLFVINSVETLQAFKAAVEAEGGLTTDVIFTEDIDMKDVDWTPIEGYAGKINGNGYALKNMTAPLFGTTSASVKGLHFENVDLKSNDNQIAAALARTITATEDVVPVIENCSVSGSVYVKNDNYAPEAESSYARYAGLIGIAYGAKINACVNNASITVDKIVADGATIASGASIGGVAASMTIFTKADESIVYSHMSNCKNNGEIKFNAAIKDLYLGGVIGNSFTNNLKVEFLSNENTAPITVNASSSSHMNIGGVASQIYGDNTGMTSDNINRGAITLNEDTYVGGNLTLGGVMAVGKSCDIVNTHNHGTITINEGVKLLFIELGGIVGNNQYANSKKSFTIKESINYGHINVASSSRSTTSASSFRIGGISSYSQATIRNCKNYGSITYSGQFNTAGNRWGADNEFKIGTYSFAGIVGYKTEGRIYACENHGAITFAGKVTETSTSKKAQFRIAGIVGYLSTNLDNSSTADDCRSKGKITVTKDAEIDCELNVGGLIGNTYSTNGGNTSEAEIEINGEIKGGLVVGGIVATTNMSVSNVENKSKITITKYATIATKLYVGGCVGQMLGTSTTQRTATNLTNSADILFDGTTTGGAHVAGCIGYSSNSSEVSGSLNPKSTTLVNNNPVTVGENAAISGANGYFAGCVGHAQNTVTTATNSANITFKGKQTSNNTYLAGCVTDLTTTMTMTGMTNSGDITFEGEGNDVRIAGCGGYVGIVENSTNTGNVHFVGTGVDTATCTVRAAGIAYYSKGMNNCVNGSAENPALAEIKIESQAIKNGYLGGLAVQCLGAAESSTNHAKMSLIGKATATVYGGGLFTMGDGTAETTRKNCVNNGEIYIDANIGSTKNVNCFIGGFTYRVQNPMTFENCHNHGDITLSNKTIVGHSIRLGGMIGTMESDNKVLTLNNCSNTGDITINSSNGDVPTKTSANGYARIGGCIGNAITSDGTVKILNEVKNTGTITFGGNQVQAKNLMIGGIAGYISKAMDGEGVLINEGEIVYSGTAALGLRIGGICGAFEVSQPTTISYINTGDVTLTGTYNTSNGTGTPRVGGVIGGIGSSTVVFENVQCFCNVKAVNYTGVGMFSGFDSTAETAILKNSKIGGTFCTDQEDRSEVNDEGETIGGWVDVVVPIKADNFLSYIYGNRIAVAANGNSVLEKKEDIVYPTFTPAEPEPETPETLEATEE